MFDVQDPYVPTVPRHPDPPSEVFSSSGSGGLHGNGAPGPGFSTPGGTAVAGGTYVNDLTGAISWVDAAGTWHP